MQRGGRIAMSLSDACRKIKNTTTGIDMSVLSHEAAPSPKQIKNYSVVVISNLPFFKLPEHSQDDTIQFTVSLQ